MIGHGKDGIFSSLTMEPATTEMETLENKKKNIPPPPLPKLIRKPSDTVLAAKIIRGTPLSPASPFASAQYFAKSSPFPQSANTRYSAPVAPPTPPPSPVSSAMNANSVFPATCIQIRQKSPVGMRPIRNDRLSATSSIFDENDRKYRCCCGGRLHIRHAALIIGVIECLITLGNLISAASLDAEYGDRAQPVRGIQTEAYLIISSAALAFFIGTVAWMGYAAAKRRKIKRSYLHLIPHMVVQMLTIMTLACSLIMLAVLAFHTKHVKVAVDAVVFVALGVGLGLELFFFILVLRCFYYLRDEYELSARAMPICVQCPVISKTVPVTMLYQPVYAYQDVVRGDYYVY